MKKLFVLFVAVVLLGSLVLAGCGGTEETTTTVAPTTTAAPTTEAPTTTVAAAVTVPWDQAIDHEGETVTVTGPVLAVVDKGAGIDKYILQIGSEGDDGFNATVEYASADAFGGMAALSALVGMDVEVTGEVYVNAFELKAEILLTDAAQFKLVGPSAAAAAATNWDAALDLEGTTATVTGPVMAVVDKGAGIDKYILQIGSEGDDGFNATVEYASADAFGGAAGLQALIGKTVEVTGEVYVNAFELKAEILLTEAAQLKIVEAAAYTADEAKAHYGEEGSVTGTVAGVVDLAGAEKWLIQLDSADDGAGFNGMVAYANIAAFGDLNTLVGKTVTVTGAIYENTFQGKGEIELTDPAQLVVK